MVDNNLNPSFLVKWGMLIITILFIVVIAIISTTHLTSSVSFNGKIVDSKNSRTSIVCMNLSKKLKRNLSNSKAINVSCDSSIAVCLIYDILSNAKSNADTLILSSFRCASSSHYKFDTVIQNKQVKLTVKSRISIFKYLFMSEK